ncbi:MAG TPA: cysteine--tRNA ligase [Rickettsiales bacterium]|nr:cysteine--tRNA ligase [Rickettsiales bacterium]
MIHLYNTLTRQKEAFTPMDVQNVRMYVCGPTVYDRAHLGNARSVVVYDVLYRLLKHTYPKVTYIRNITDVDDKINTAAKNQKITIQELTQKVTGWFHDDMAALNVLNPDKEPKATEHIRQMIAMIEQLIKNNIAYVSEGHVLFSVSSYGAAYGALSGRVQEELESGARIKVESYKRNPNDFVLWKPADAEDDASSVFESPWGKGRPGWHIECSAMSTEYLGRDFDIHGGGADLMFPHHENEIAQACGAYPESHFAKYWVHNGFLTVNGEKMSKSLGNFITVRDLLDKGIKGEVIRYALLKTRYREPLDFNEKLMEDAKKELDGFYRKLSEGAATNNMSADFLAALHDDMNFPKALSALHACTPEELRTAGSILGILQQNPEEWFKGDTSDSGDIDALVAARIAAKKAKNWAEADKIRNDLKAQGIILEDRPDGTTDWRRE